MDLMHPPFNGGAEHLVSRPIDLRQLENASPQFQMLHALHETFARSLSNALSSFVQSEIDVHLSGIQLTTIQDFHDAFTGPNCPITLRLKPGAERVVLCLDCATALTLLTLLLGGEASPTADVRPLTEIEWSLLEEITSVIARELSETWQSVKAVECVVESLGSDPSQMGPPYADVPALRIGFDLPFGEQLGRLEIAVACSFFDIVVPTADVRRIEEPTPSIEINRNARLLENAKVNLQVHLQGQRLTFGALLALRPGQVIKFDHALSSPVQCVANGDPFCVGHIVSTGRKRAFQVEGLSS